MRQGRFSRDLAEAGTRPAAIDTAEKQDACRRGCGPLLDRLCAAAKLLPLRACLSTHRCRNLSRPSNGLPSHWSVANDGSWRER
jgi:hypothetical protein